MMSLRTQAEQQMIKRFPRRTVLCCGRSFQLYCSRGAIIVAVCGTLEVSESQGFADAHVPRVQFHVPEGEAHIVQQSGWLTIFAPADAEVTCLPKENRMRCWLEQVLAGLRRMRRARAGR